MIYSLPDIPNDTFAGLNPTQFPNININNGLSSWFDNPLQNPLLNTINNLLSLPPIQGNMMSQTQAQTQAPRYDNWTLPKGTAGGVLNPLPTYKVGTGPTMASMRYTTPIESWATPASLTKMPAQYEPYVQEAAKLYHMDPNLIKAIMRAESNFNPNDVSSAGAVGLMQLMPDTAADAGITDAQRWDPRMNILAATRYIRNIYDKYQNWPLTLAAYNSGPNKRTIRSGQIPNIKETRDYVRRVMALWGMGW